MGFAVSKASSACFAWGVRCFSANAATVSWPRQPQASAGGASISESTDDARQAAKKVRTETGRLKQDSSRIPPAPGSFCKRVRKPLKTKDADGKKSCKREKETAAC